MKDIEKDFLAGFFIACFVGFWFYYTNLGTVHSKVDVYWVEFGMIMPFMLPLFFLFKYMRSKLRRVKKYDVVNDR